MLQLAMTERGQRIRVHLGTLSFAPSPSLVNGYVCPFGGLERIKPNVCKVFPNPISVPIGKRGSGVVLIEKDKRN